MDRLEANRNKFLETPEIHPVQSAAEYKVTVSEAITSVLHFIQDQEVMSLDGLPTAEQIIANQDVQGRDGGDRYFGAGEHLFHAPWPPDIGEHHDYFFNFSHREPIMEEAHEMVGHHFDGLRRRKDAETLGPIRSARRLFKIGVDRDEGWAFGLEELLVHAGMMDGRNAHGREIAYEQVRILQSFRRINSILSDFIRFDSSYL